MILPIGYPDITLFVYGDAVWFIELAGFLGNYTVIAKISIYMTFLRHQ